RPLPWPTLIQRFDPVKQHLGHPSMSSKRGTAQTRDGFAGALGAYGGRSRAPGHALLIRQNRLRSDFRRTSEAAPDAPRRVRNIQFLGCGADANAVAFRRTIAHF